MLQKLIENIQIAQKQALEEISQAGSQEQLEAVRLKYLSGKGVITDIMKSIGALPVEDRPKAGGEANRVKEAVALAYKESLSRLERLNSKSVFLDVTLSGRQPNIGHRHLLSKTMDEICQIFSRLGFSIAQGPEVELDYYNFEALNFPADHPARDMQDTFFVGHNLLLRTHTSPVQIRAMESNEPPVWVIAPGKTYRRDSDITHSPMFNQVEGLAVDQGIRFSDLKGILQAFVQEMFSPSTKIRMRPSFFPFTEPSAEVDIACVLCSGKGCRLCKNTGWLEILGSGLIDPALYGFVNYDPEKYSGFAFGMGIERIAMLKYGISDIRLLYEGDLRFLNQF